MMSMYSSPLAEAPIVEVDPEASASPKVQRGGSDGKEVPKPDASTSLPATRTRS